MTCQTSNPGDLYVVASFKKYRNVKMATTTYLLPISFTRMEHHMNLLVWNGCVFSMTDEELDEHA